MKRTRIVGGKLLQRSPTEGTYAIHEATIVLCGAHIEAITTQPTTTPSEEEEIVDGRRKLYMPGLINTHGHAPMAILRGLQDDAPLHVWLQQHMWPAEARFTAKDVRAGAMLAIVEMMRTGTTTFLDMYDRMEIVAEAVAQTGMRACLSRGIIGLCSVEEQREKLAQAIQFVQQWHHGAQGRITTMIAPHAPYTCPPALLTQLIEASAQYDVPLHIHLSETAEEVSQNVATYGVRPVAHLMNLGCFARPTLVAHAVHVDEAEIAVFAQHSVAVSHNPRSNLKLGSGVAPVVAMQRAGVCVALGTDSAASNNNLDMFQEMRTAALLHKGVLCDPTVIPIHTALNMATVHGATALQLTQIGELAVGMKADMIALDLDAPHLQPTDALLSHLVYSASGSDVVDVWIDGKRVLNNRVCTTIDEEKVRYDAQIARQCVVG
jgi:5-methylthioadenosine/S-adenosylhomocysteine deaminase